MGIHLKMSDIGKSEYCCNVVRIGEVKPIEGSDFLGQTFVNGNSMVVRKDQVKEGMLMFYAPNESQLNHDFLSANNLYEIGCYEKNQNCSEVEALINANKKDDAKRMCGFFNKHGRVRMIRLRGVPSMGYLFTLEELIKYKPNASHINMEEMINVDFDTIDDELFIKAYVPPMPEERKPRTKSEKRQKNLKKFDRIIPGTFAFHYDTNPLAKNMHRINPEDNVSISVKMHGTSAIYANVQTKVPIKLSFLARLWNKFIDCTGLFKSFRAPDYSIGWGDVYSSRTVIKNKDINPDTNGGYYKVDVWGEYNELLKNYIPRGMTIYGEIVGYLTGSQSMIQKGFDYGCEVGTNKFMPYRIVTEDADGVKHEWDVKDVITYTQMLRKMLRPDDQNKIIDLPLLYNGTLRDLYKDVDPDNHWHENVLMKMKMDKMHFGMEELEPLCNLKAPREGICLRIDGDIEAKCFKLKTDLFAEKEAKAVDAGAVDIEMAQAYGSDEDTDA